jgi:DNA polymerase III epsilon subunit-like protein
MIWSDREIPPWVARLTGISNRDLEGAPTFSDVADTVAGLLDGNVFVAHDIRFDLPFLRWEFARRGVARPAVTGLCTLQLSRQIWPNLESRSLNDLARHFGVAHNNPHRASADAAATAGILDRALADARGYGLNDLGDLFRIEQLAGARIAAACDGDDLAAESAES